MKKFILPRQYCVKSLMALLLLPVIYVSVTNAQAAKNNGVKTPEEVEARVVGKIAKNLDLFLTKNQYRIFATAKVKNYREKIILEGELESKSSGEEKNTEKQNLLPGFENIEEKKASPKKVNRKEKSKFVFRNRSKLQSIAIRLVLEKTLAKEAKDLAFNSAKDSIDQSVGEKGTIELVELDLTPPATSTTTWQWFTEYLNKRGASAIDLLYLSLLLISFLGSFLAIRHYFKGKKLAKDSSLPISQNNLIADKRKEDEICNKLLDDLIGYLNGSPLITRVFLKNLSAEDRVSIFNSLKTPAMQSYFQKILMIDQQGGNGKNSSDINSVFEKVLKDLKRYIQLNNEMEQKPFGYIPQFTGEQVAQFLSNEPSRIEALKVIAPYLATHQMKEVTKLLSIEEKALFFDFTGDEIKNSLVSPALIAFKEKVETKLRLVYENIKAESVVDITTPETLELNFLDSDQDCIEVIKMVVAKKGKVPKAYEKYLVSFEDFLGLELGITKKVIQKVSNEVLTMALANRKIDDGLNIMIGDMRSQLIESLKKRDNNFTKADVENAKSEVLRQYRALI